VLVTELQLIALGQGLRDVLAPVVEGLQIAFGVGFDFTTIDIDHLGSPLGLGLGKKRLLEYFCRIISGC
jgi:hypothetical protein